MSQIAIYNTRRIFMPFKTVNILGFNFLKTTKDDFLEQLQPDLLHQKKRFIITANPEIIMYARKHPNYSKIVKSADYLVADGIGIVKASQFTNTKLTERITGFDLFNDLLKWANTHQSKVYLLGSKDSVIKAVVQKIHSEFPQINIVGYHDGYFKNEAPIVEEIKKTKPNFVFVATGFPKQEEFISAHQSVASAIWMGIGGSFDVYAGNVKRAPLFWQKHNIEWLYRLITDPKRIKRQIVLPIFLLEAFLKRKQ